MAKIIVMKNISKIAKLLKPSRITPPSPKIVKISVRKIGLQYSRVCLSHFSELETGDKQAFDTHNQNADTKRVYKPVSRTSCLSAPFLVGGIKTLRSCSAQFDPGIGTALGMVEGPKCIRESKRLCVYRRVSSSSGDHRAIKSHKFVAFKSGRLNGYQNGFAFIEGDLVG